jgi:tetratricopeptide (TPR) repeat protein
MRRHTVLLVVGLLFVLPGSRAQIPDSYENLEILPREISKSELVPIMRGFAGALGVRCSHCHVGPDNLQGMDFATDERPTKRVARKMMKMVASINADTLSGLETGRERTVEVDCRTCHRGVTVPAPIDRLVEIRLSEEDAEAAATFYRELREQYYGSAAYDFSPRPLNSLAERLGGSDQTDAALAVLRLNLEFSPDDPATHLMIGRIHAARGELDQAIAATKEALRLDPDNRWARSMLERLEQAAGQDDG